MKDKVKYWFGDIDDLYNVNGIYSKNNFVDKNGKYKRLYWDKVNGSWGKKKEVFKSKKYYWYEFDKIINEKNIVKLFEDFSDDEYLSFKYIDRVGYFISEIYNEIMLKESLRNGVEFGLKKDVEGVYISYRNLEGILGKDFRKIIDRLCYIDLLIVKDGGSNINNRNYRLFKYDLNEKLLGKVVGKKFNENKVLEKFLLNRNSENLLNVNLNELKFIKELSFNISEERLEEICNVKWENKKNEIKRELSWGKMFNKEELRLKKELMLMNGESEYKELVKKRYVLFKDKLVDIRNGLISSKIFFRDNKIYRSYNLINGMDKEFRKELRYKGKELVELDIKSCFISCLLYFLERLMLFNRIQFEKERKKSIRNLEENKKVNRLYYEISELNKNYKESGNNNVLELIEEKNKELIVEKLKSKRRRIRNKKNSGIEFNYKEDRGIRYMNYSELRSLFYNKDKIFSLRYDIDLEYVKELYDWGNVNEDRLSDKIKRLKKIDKKRDREEKYYEIYNELKLILNGKNIVNESINNVDFRGINNNYINFFRSDNLINEISRYKFIRDDKIDRKLDKSKVIDGVIYYGKDWESNFSYNDYKLLRGELFNNVLKDNISKNEKISKWFVESWEKKKIDDDYFIEDWENKMVNYYEEISKVEEYRLKIDLLKNGEKYFKDFKNIINKEVKEFKKDDRLINYRNEFEDDIELFYWEIDIEKSVEYLDEFINNIKKKYDFNYDFELMLNIERNYSSYGVGMGGILNYNIKGYGYDEFIRRYIVNYKKKNRKLVKKMVNIKWDRSKIEEIDYNDFIVKNKDFIVGDKSDFYNYLKFKFSRKIYSDRLVKGKEKIMSIENYLSNLININEWGDRNVYNRDFYKLLVLRLLFSFINLSEGINNKLFGNMMKLVFGDELSYLIKKIKSSELKVDVFGDKVKNDKNYINLFRILGMIEVDVIDYLENNYFIDSDDFYCKIFDGVMVEKDKYFEKRLELNLLLKENVGYMFEMK